MTQLGFEWPWELCHCPILQCCMLTFTADWLIHFLLMPPLTTKQQLAAGATNAVTIALHHCPHDITASGHSHTSSYCQRTASYHPMRQISLPCHWCHCTCIHHCIIFQRHYFLTSYIKYSLLYTNHGYVAYSGLLFFILQTMLVCIWQYKCVWVCNDLYGNSCHCGCKIEAILVFVYPYLFFYTLLRMLLRLSSLQLNHSSLWSFNQLLTSWSKQLDERTLDMTAHALAGCFSSKSLTLLGLN